MKIGCCTISSIGSLQNVFNLKATVVLSLCIYDSPLKSQLCKEFAVCSAFSVAGHVSGTALLLISMLLLIYSYASSAPVLHDSMPPFGRLCERDIAIQRVEWTTMNERRGRS